jgi:hypothetical protein
MPYELEIDPTLGLCIIRGIGEVTDADVDAARVELQGNTSFQPHFSEILDLTRVTQFSVTAERLRKLGADSPLYARKSRRVFIAPTAVGFGLGRMFQMLRGDEAGDIRVFRDFDEALHWLGQGDGEDDDEPSNAGEP